MAVIVSLTTTSERIELAYYGVQSLLRQNYKADKIIINLEQDAFSSGEQAEFTNWLESNNILVNWTTDIGPYTKLIPTLSLVEEDDLIVTADDDTLYQKEWLRCLVQLHNDNPDKIVCSRARVMKKNLLGRWKNYSEWPDAKHRIEGKMLLPLGVGGVVYTKRLLNLDFVLDERFSSLSTYADDLWFRMGSLLKSVKVLAEPSIYAGTNEIVHVRGVSENNIVKIRDSSLIVKGLKKLTVKTKGNLGIPVSRNDRYWRNIVDFVKDSYGYEI